MAAGGEVQLGDSRLKKLERLIRESFRVRDNRTPVYVDIAGNLDRIALRQHQIVFGRRGSGKSCLLVYYRHKVAPEEDVHDAGSSATDRAGLAVGARGVSGNLSSEQTENQSTQEVRESDEQKAREIENRLSDYKSVIQNRIEESGAEFAVFIIDDFYLIDSDVQPDVIDYIHRLLRDTDLYFKVGTVRHRTRLLKTAPLHVGVQIQQDVDGFNLDQTLEDLEQTGTYLGTMLRELAKQVGIENDVLSIMSDEANKDLVLLSGGVPRDYLNIFVGGLERAAATPNRKTSPLRTYAEPLRI